MRPEDDAHQAAKDRLLAEVLSHFEPFEDAVLSLRGDLRDAGHENARREARALLYSGIWASLLSKGHKSVRYSGNRRAVAHDVAQAMSSSSGRGMTPKLLEERASEYSTAIQVVDERHPPGIELSRLLRVRAGLPEFDILLGMRAPIVFGLAFGKTNELLEIFEETSIDALRGRFRRGPPKLLPLVAVVLIVAAWAFAFVHSPLALTRWPTWLAVGTTVVVGAMLAARASR